MVDDERGLCARYASRIRAYGLRHLRDSTAAQDLVQQVLLAVLQALRAGRVEDLDRLDHYVFGTCRNAVLDMRRGSARQRRLAERASEGTPEVFTPDWTVLDARRLEDCLRALDPRGRAVVLATFLEDRDADDIASALQLTVGNVRVIRHRALSRLQVCVERGPS